MKLRAIFLAFAILFSSLQSIAAAPPKAGAICSKLGSFAINNGKKFTCIKSGKKLIWNKGVVVKSAAPSPSPTIIISSPSPTPTPTTSPSPTPSVTPTRQNPKGPTSFDDLVERYDGISYAAWSKSQTAITNASDVAPPYKALIGQNTKLLFQKPSVAFDVVARLYSGFKSSEDFTVLFFGYEDRLWAQEQMKQLQPDHDSRWITYTACATRATCWGAGVFTDQKARVLVVISAEVSDKNHTSGTLEAHEYTHAIQQNQMRRPSPWPPIGDWPPTWFIEGQALFAQNASIYFDSFEMYTLNRRETADELFRDPTINSEWIQEYFVINAPATWFSKYKSWRQYDLGGMLVEILTAIKGPSSTMEVWKLMGNGSTFPDAFAKVYGVSFEKALPIISKAIALQLGRS